MTSRRVFLGSLLAVLLPISLAGQQPTAPRRAPDVHFVPTDVAMVHALLKAAKVGKDDVVYDLGCGDGRIVITAVKRYKATRGVCVDIDPVRIAESRRNADTAGVAKRIAFHEGDLFQMDLREASVVTLYLLPALNERLRPKLFRELRPGSRVVSNSFDMGDWKADRILNANPSSEFFNFAYYWMMPADVAGTWKVSLEGGSAYTLKLEQRYQHLTGTASAGDRTVPLSELFLEGDRMRFVITDSLAGKPRTLRFTGRIADDRAEGTVKGADKSRTWTAERTERGERPELAAKDRTGS